jgi:mono/diheme cytochrome c family protein
VAWKASGRAVRAEKDVARKSWRISLVGSAAIAAVLSIPVARPIRAATETPRPTNPYEGRSDLVPEGKSLFNQYCSHCHGPNAQQGERPRDLRRLRIRYGDDAITVFYTTINEGRMDKGMPPWKGVLSDDLMWRIFTFLDTVQTPP